MTRMKLVIASNNEDKVKEIKKILANHFETVLSLKEAGIDCEPNENGKTFWDNALIKANEAAKYTDYAVLADDTGLCVDALNGEPGIMSARYGGDHSYAKNRAKLLKELDGKSNRSAYFYTAVVLRYPNGKTIIADGRADGYILKSEQGTQSSFGYDSIFFSTDLNKSFGQASEEEKNSVSHRARALKNLLKQID